MFTFKVDETLLLILVSSCCFFGIFDNVAATSSQQKKLAARLYSFESNVQSDLPNNTDFFSNASLAFHVSGEFSESTIYGHDDKHRCKILLMQIKSMKLLTRENKLSASKLELTKNEPFLLQLCDKHIEKIFIDPREEISIKNLKKAIASLFQFQTVNTHVEETDVCGSCQVTYDVVSHSKILKRKEHCRIPPQNRSMLHSVPISGAIKNVKRQVLYEIDESDHSKLVTAAAQDAINIHSNVKKDFGVFVNSTLKVTFKEMQDSLISNMGTFQAIEEAIHEVTRELKLNLKPDILHLAEEPVTEELNPLQKTIEMNYKFMSESELGTSQSAAAFLKILHVVMQSSEEDIIRVLKNKKNEPILNQIMDVLGCAQTLPVHKAILKTYNLKKIKNIDSIERYLWAISVGKRPKLEFLHDFVKIFKENPVNDKLKETILLTIAALANKLSEESKENIFKIISNDITMCPKNDHRCTAMYLRALKNLKYDSAKSILLHYSLTGSRVVSVNALKAIYKLPRSSWDEQVLKAADKIYYQKDKRYDSTARAIAIDILVDSNPDRETLNHLVESLKSNTTYETRKYLLQRLYQTASINKTFDQILRDIMRQQNLFNYNFLAQKGLSNALTRPILESENLNMSIVTVNEVSKSLLKRGHISVILEQNDNNTELVSLDMFTSGLSSFLWSDDTVGEEEIDEPEELTAGFEIALYGVQMRPFIFYRGHAELMGHIWAGTASEKTPIIQALRLFLENSESFALSTGNILTVAFIGSISSELTGRITFSIWNRNAHSFGDAKIAAIVAGSMSLNTFFVRNNVKIEVASESQMEITSNLDFYDEVLFCLQISQTKTIISHQLENQQVILDTNRKLGHRKKVQYFMPGRTIALNKRNNEMCNTILQNNPEL